MLIKCTIYTLVLICLVSMGVYASPSVSNINSPSTAALYDKFEVSFDVSTVASNPYWPYDPSPAANTSAHPNAVPAGVGVSVDGLFLPPGASDWNSAVVQPAFYMIPFQSNGTDIVPGGNPTWKIRFAPTAQGAWQFKIRVTDSSGATTSQVSSFNCSQGSSRGFVRVSPNDCRYFETSDGKYLNIAGVNCPNGVTDSDFATYGANGINLLRPWWNGSQGPVLFGLSGQGGAMGWGEVLDGAYHSPHITGEQVRPGELFSGKLALGTNSLVYTSPQVKPNTTYKFSVWVKTVGLQVSSGGGLYLQAYDCTQQDVVLSQKLSGDHDWMELTGSLTTKPGQTRIDFLKLRLDGRQSGTVYYTDWTLAEDKGSGSYGPNIVPNPSFNKHMYVSQLEAYKADHQVDVATQNNVYLKIVLEEKDEIIFGNIMPNGTAGSYDYHDSNLYNNVRADATHASRNYQTYFWRYMIARYGYATNIHSFELFNEDDPFNSIHYAAAEALAKYFKDNDPNAHLVTTSNWHSYPTGEFWANSSYSDVGYSDWHQYIGKQTGSSLQYRFGWDFGGAGGTTTAWLDGANTYLDKTTYNSAPASLYINGDGTGNGLTMNEISIAPGHNYTLSWKIKGRNLTFTGTKAGSTSWEIGPTIRYVEKSGWWTSEIGSGLPNIGGVVPSTAADNMGTYDWKSKSTTFTALADAHYIILQPTTQYAVGEVWFDDIKLHDNTSNEDVAILNGSFDTAIYGQQNQSAATYYDSRLDYDTAIVNYAIGAQVGTNETRAKKAPCIRGELGLSGDATRGNPYKGFGYVGENQELVDDTDGIWYKKLVWGEINQFGVIDLYWWTDNIMSKGLYKYTKAYQAFMSNIALSNGNYQDAAATTSNPSIRVLGQKDLTNKKVHLWIDNAPYTWKAVVDHNYSPAAWNSAATYAKDSTCGGGSPTHVYKSLQDNNKNHPITDTAWWSDTGAFNSSALPALPSPVTGTVTVTGLADGTYTVDWWDTTTGTVTSTETKTCTGGSLTLDVNGLVSDKACQIYQHISSPTGSIDISNGSLYTGSRSVTLSLSATDADTGVSSMHFSDDGINWTDWEAYNTSKGWTLPNGDGAKTVSVQYMNNGMLTSPVYYRTIILDTLQPSGTISINSGSASTVSQNVTLSIAASDSGSGVAQMRFSNDGSTWTAWEIYAASKSWTLSAGDGSKTVYAQFQDGAANISQSTNGSITLNTGLPTGSIGINSGAQYAVSTSVTLNLSASDTGSGISQMRFSNDGSTWGAWEAYATSKQWTLTTGDGTKTVYVQYKNNAGSVSATYTGTIVLDTTQPSGTVNINSGAQYTGAALATLTVSASDSGSGISQMRFSNDGSNWGNWETYAASKAWMLLSGDGLKTVYGQFKDNAGNLSATVTHGITLDTTPPACSVVINSGDANTSSTSVTLTLSATDTGSGVAQMRFSNDGSTWSAWEAYATSKSWTLTPGDGTKTVYTQYKDVVGNSTASFTDTINLASSVPGGTISINSGAQYATSTSVTLTLSATDSSGGVSQMRFSNDGSTWSAWETYATSKSWALATGDGTKSVYVQYKNNSGTSSPTYSSTIVLDATKPSGTLSINNGAQYANLTAVTLNLSASDSGSGVSQMRFSTDGSTWNDWEAYATTRDWTFSSDEGSKTVYVQYSDAAGNLSTAVNYAMTLDVTPPTGAMVINSGSASTPSSSVTLNLSATDSGSGLSQMRFSNDGTNWSALEEYASSKAWTLSAGNGSKTVYAQFVDGASNISQSVSASIVVDVSLPSGSIVINNGAQSTSLTTVALTLSATDNSGSSISQMRLSNDGTTWNAWETYATSKSWTIPSGDGTKTVYVQYKNNLGLVSPTCSSSIILDTTQPTGSVAINSGAAYASSASVTLTLSVTDAANNVTQMRFSNNGTTWSTWEAYATSKSWTLVTGVGTKTVYVQFKDSVGNVSANITSTIIVDTSAPTGSISINNGAQYAASTAVTLTFSAADAGSGVAQLRLSSDGSTWNAWEAYVSSKPWTLSAGDGSKAVYVQYMNKAGSTSLAYIDRITLDTTGPSGTISVNSGALYTASLSATLTLSAADAGSGISQMHFSNDGTTWSAWESYATSKAWTLASGDGTKTVYVQYKDVMGNTSAPITGTITLDASAPIGTIVINSGDLKTSSKTVTLTLSASDASGVPQMRFSSNGTTWNAWENYATTRSWTLTTGDGTKTVYVQYKNGAGMVSSICSASIILDTTQSSGSISINKGAQYTNWALTTLTISATDSASGVAQMHFSNDGITWSPWEGYTTSKSWALATGDGTKTVYFQYKNNAGTVSQSYSSSIILDTTQPSGSIAFSAGSQNSSSLSVVLTLSATDLGSGVSQMHFSNDGNAWSAWEAYGTSKSWTLASGNGAKTAYVQYMDVAGNVSASYNATKTLMTSLSVITITSPTSDPIYSTNRTSISIKGAASGDITNLSWSADSGETGLCTGTTSWETADIPLSVGQKVITITGVDGNGAQVTQSITLRCVDVHPPTNWGNSTNLVSVPIIPDEPDPKAAIGFSGDQWCMFEPVQNNYIFYTSDPSNPTWFLPAEATPGRGFWAQFSDPASVPLGRVPAQDQPATIHLYPGWNIIGNPYISPVQWDVTRITVTPVGGTPQQLQNSGAVVENYLYGWQWSGGAGTYFIVYDANLSPGSVSTLQPWNGYWIIAYQECDLTIPAPGN